MYTDNIDTRRATKEVFEELYTNNDIIQIDGPRKTFEYPTKWSFSSSLHKRVGIRKLDIIPTSHIMNLFVTVDTKQYPIHVEITQDNNLIEILNYIMDKLNELMTDDEVLIGYTYKDNKLTISCNQQFSITNGQDELLRFLNQDVDSDIFTSSSSLKVLNGVWDRRTLYYHSNFSNSNRQYIGTNSDKYITPNKQFNSSNTDTTFDIWTTTDGKNIINIRYAKLHIELYFVYNYLTALVN